MAKKTNKTLTDARGYEFNPKILHPNTVKRDAMVKKVTNMANKLNQKITAEKEKMLREVHLYLDSVADEYNEKWKGNAQLLSFDEKEKVEINYQERISFDEKLQIAKQKIDSCLKRWSQEANPNLQALVSQAFQVDKKGQVSKNRIMALLRFNIKDDEWDIAKKIILESITVTSTKQYLAIYQRENTQDKFKQIILNFSALD